MKKRITGIVILGAASLLGWKLGEALQEQGAANADLRRAMAAAVTNRDAARAALETLREEAEAARAERTLLLARLSAPGRGPDPGMTDPARAWSTPPEVWPEWNPESPFVWLDKKVLPRFSVTAFESDGALSPGIAAVLTLDPDRVWRLDEVLRSLDAEHRRESVSRARVLDEHLPEVAREEGEKRTVRVDPMPEVSERIRGRFEAALVEYVGRQRADILTESSRAWISEHFPGSLNVPLTVSVVVRPDGTYRISMRTGNGGMSTGGSGSFLHYIPPHLRPLFESFAADQAPAAGR